MGEWAQLFWFLLGLSLGSLGAWIRFKKEGRLRTRGEVELARIFGDEIVGMKSMQTVQKIAGARPSRPEET